MALINPRHNANSHLRAQTVHLGDVLRELRAIQQGATATHLPIEAEPNVPRGPLRDHHGTWAASDSKCTGAMNYCEHR
ncbi:hypothetical protein N7447_001706 [Penicillium robsamsonii]|uniref:uncharacterized protein n=1 Tax=Penicillium robsamsonii TaxID=1792511 RepID=UPI002547960D|nr:uncharacterized protein N7447_001706 [Penicillium robsamsonii]KAJ5835680.1 hypothetical protein N7447_001706 [Penicillium robsamsonii]